MSTIVEPRTKEVRLRQQHHGVVDVDPSVRQSASPDPRV